MSLSVRLNQGACGAGQHMLPLRLPRLLCENPASAGAAPEREASSISPLSVTCPHVRYDAMIEREKQEAAAKKREEEAAAAAAAGALADAAAAAEEAAADPKARASHEAASSGSLHMRSPSRIFTDGSPRIWRKSFAATKRTRGDLL